MSSLQTIAPVLAAFAVFGTVFGLIIRGWTTIKAFGQKCFGIFFIKIHLDDESTAKTVLGYLVVNFKSSKSSEKTFGGKYEFFKDGRYGLVSYESFGFKTIMFWKGWIPFWFSVRIVKDEGKQIYWGLKPKDGVHNSIIFIRGTVDVDEIIGKAVRENNNLRWSNTDFNRFFIKKIPDINQIESKRFSAGNNLEWYNENVYRIIDYKKYQLGKSSCVNKGKISDNLYFPPEAKSINEEISIWKNMESWYKEKSIPWKRGYLLYGPAGTGKSVLVRALAEDFDMPLFTYSLGRITDADLEKSWIEMQSHTPCIALFEDFDTVFHGRENIYGKPSISNQIASVSIKKDEPVSNGNTDLMNIGQLSFGCLLNCIDGVEKTNGIILFITTNHIELLDPAIGQPVKREDGSVEIASTRPGRIDRAVELGYMREEDKILFAKRIFSDDPIGLEIMIKKIHEEKANETPARFQERCTQLALKLLWNKELLK